MNACGSSLAPSELSPEGDLVDLACPAPVADVEDRCLRTQGQAVGGGVGAEPEQPVVADRVQVGGEARDLQLAQPPGVRGVGEVDRVERVDLPEGHHHGQVVEPAHRLDLLVDAEPAQLADRLQPVTPLVQYDDPVLACCPSRSGQATATRRCPSCSSSDQRSLMVPLMSPEAR